MTVPILRALAEGKSSGHPDRFRHILYGGDFGRLLRRRGERLSGPAGIGFGYAVLRAAAPNDVSGARPGDRPCWIFRRLLKHFALQHLFARCN